MQENIDSRVANSAPTLTAARRGWSESAVRAPPRWYNAIPRLPEPLPPARDPEDGSPSRVAKMRGIRIPALVEQDESQQPWIDVPPEVLASYASIGRPTPLHRAVALERHLGTPAHIYLKREDVLPTGSFKLNSALAQAYYARRMGAKALVTETGAGQWGVAVAYACSVFGLDSVVFWVRVSMEQKIGRATLARMYGATVYPSPSEHTAPGRSALERDPRCPGSLGTGIADAVSHAVEHPEYKYVSGSNLPHVLLHQTVIGLETKAQLAEMRERADALVACVGGGSNLGGLMLPFLDEKLERGDDLLWFAAESDAAPRLTRGSYRYDHSDPACVTPLTLSYSLGHDYMPPPVHVGGLRQHNGSAIIGILRKSGLLDARAYAQREAFEAGKLLVATERIVPAPESCHAIRAVVDLALRAKEEGRPRVIVSCLSGNGLLDLSGYASVLGV